MQLVPVVTRGAYEHLREQLVWGKVIDFDAFQAVDGQWLIRPALAYQSRYSNAADAVTVESSKSVNDAYLNKCAFDGEW